MKGEREVLELQLIEANEHFDDLYTQLRDKWLMGKERLIVEFEMQAALRDLEAICDDYKTYH